MKENESNMIEKVSEAIAHKFSEIWDSTFPVIVFAGKGNNGSDGLAVARILSEWGYSVKVVSIFGKGSGNRENSEFFDNLPADIRVYDPADFKSINSDRAILIDAIFGTGISGELKNSLKFIFHQINTSGNCVVSIDLPSGLSPDFSGSTEEVIKADYTFAVEFPKISLLLEENRKFAGEIVVIKAGILEYERSVQKIDYTYVDSDFAKSLVNKRDRFSHKGMYGHALLICGGEGMAGAAVLATGGALRSGCGLVTTHISRGEANVIHNTNPSAIVSIDQSNHFSTLPENIEKYDSLGVGCGIGKKPETCTALLKLFERYKKPMVIDADAINIVASSPSMQILIPKFSILTPHAAELRRLLGDWRDEYDKYQKIRSYSIQSGNIVVSKGAYTKIFSPDGSLYVNSSGTPALAKAGSGDVLSGLITGLLAKGMRPIDAAILGVYRHGRAGEDAAEERGEESVNSKDVIDFIKF